MNIEMLEKMDWIIFNAIVGSHAYGTSVPTSDQDYRGIFIAPMEMRVSIFQQLAEVGQEKPTDKKYYEIAKFMALAKDCNPNIIEFLFMPEDCILKCEPKMKRLIECRNLFVSKKAYHTFSGYSFAQIKKAKGEHKWVNNPQPKEQPQRQDFCWIMGRGMVDSKTPCRPVPYRTQLEDGGYPLEMCHVSALEHVSNTYRLYYYGSEAKGVFRNGNLVCESIPLDEEQGRFIGLLIYNEQEYEKAMLNWKNYWTWMENKNKERWIMQERGEIDYDCKNIMHCMRLMISGESILRTGEPIIRFEGQQLQYLRDIRAGRFSYNMIMDDVEKRMVDMKIACDASTLPWGPDEKKIDDLYRELVIGD